MKAYALLLTLLLPQPSPAHSLLNDIHSQLNASEQNEVVRPVSVKELRNLVIRAQREKRGISIQGGGHSMGGQQYGKGTLHVDMGGMDKLISVDEKRAVAIVEAGIQWPALIEALHTAQGANPFPLTIRQKQTGADNMSIGGALSSNVHGRGLRFAPFVEDVESFWLMGANGREIHCSRLAHPELFRRAIGGYGLFGIITRVELRLVPRQKLERRVELATVENVVQLLMRKSAEGAVYGDFQFSIDGESPTFLRNGIISTYHALPNDAVLPEGEKELGADDWRQLYMLAHVNKTGAYERYVSYYLSTDKQRYWSDTSQLSVYLPDYHAAIDAVTRAKVKGTEMITELYVPREKLQEFMRLAAEDFRRNKTNVIYGTVRLIEADKETALPWAKANFAAIVFNLHVDHDAVGIARAKKEFRGLIDRALSLGGNYYLTYHRWATAAQVRRGYPEMEAFLAAKRHLDPQEIFTSDWYRAMKKALR